MCAAWHDNFCWSERDEAIDFDGVAGYDWTLTEAVAPAPSEGRAVSGSTPVAVGVLLLHHVDRVIESLSADSPSNSRSGRGLDSPRGGPKDATERSAA